MEVLQRTFQDVMPAFGSYKNPVDITGQAGGGEYRAALERAFAEPDINAILALYCDRGDAELDTIKQALAEVHAAHANKPALYTIFGGEGASGVITDLKLHCIPSFCYVVDAVSSLYALFAVNETKDEGSFDPVEMDEDAIRTVIGRARAEGRGKLFADEAKEVLRAAGVSVPPFVLATTIDEAVAAADDIGYPVVMKVVSDDIVHKSDVGGVILDIDDAREAADAYEAITESCRRHVPGARIRGIEVTKMLPRGVEVIVGATSDASFGKVVMFGLGGIYVEVMKDVTFRVAPVPKDEIRRMVRDIESFPLLAGVRGERGKDVAAIVDAIYRVGVLVDRFAAIVELDINPLLVYEHGVQLADARMSIKVKA
jgi:acetyltransferase